MPTESLRMPVLRVPQFARKHGITSLVLLTVLALNLLAGISLLGVNVTQGRAVARVTPHLPAEIAKVAPAPEPLQFRSDVAPQDALAINAAVPISDSPNPAARPFCLLSSTRRSPAAVSSPARQSVARSRSTRARRCRSPGSLATRGITA